MGKMNYDDEIKLRNKLITNYDNSFIMAGAGAGKTYTLVNRIVNHIKAGADVAKIVAISFTNKSAEDLKERIIGALDVTRLSKDKLNELSPSEKARMEDALNRIDLMHISTIHKFCGDILKENSLYAKVSPGFKMIVDEDEYNLKNKVFKKYINEVFKESDLDIIDLTYKNISSSISDIERIYNILNKYIDKIEFKDIYVNGESQVNLGNIKSAHKAFKKAFIGYLEKFQDEAPEIFEIYKEETGKGDNIKEIINKKFHDYLDLSLSDVKKNHKIINPFYKDIKIDGSPNEIKPFSGTKIKSGRKKEAVDEFMDEASSFISDMVSNKNVLEREYKLLVLHHGYKAYEAYLDYIDKDYDNISNDELLYLTKKLLENNHDIRLKLQQKYRYLYIDEYQDTDHIQRDIALLLTQDDNKKFLPDSSLFLVGDPKQSIYRFRGAEPQIYYDTKNIYDKKDDHELNINFRSNSKIIDYVNFIYDTKSNPDGIRLTEDDYSKMLVNKTNIISDEEYENKENLIGFYSASANDENGIVKIINCLKNNYKLREVKDGKAQYRSIKYGDIMVLMPGHSKMGKYVEEFSKNKIPSKVAGESNFYTTLQVRVFVNLYEALNASGKTSNNIAYEAFRLLYPKKYEDKNVKEALKISEALLNNLKYQTRDMSSYGVALYLINNLDLINIEGDEIPYFKMNSIKSKLYQMVEEVFSSDYLNGKEAAKKFRKYISKNVDYESLIDDKADAVSIINIHKSKGLEAPIVIYVSMPSAPANLTEYKNGKLYINDTDGRVLDYYSDKKEVLEQVENDNNLEAARLEYVAVTRAKEAFIIIPKAKTRLFNNSIYFVNKHIRELHMPEDDIISKEEIEKIPYKPTTYECINDKPSIIITSPSSKEGESELRNKLKLEAIAKGMDIDTDRPKGNILGTVLHRSFELLVLARKNNLNIDYDEFASKAIFENEEDILDKDDYNTFIVTCLKNLDKYFIDNKIYDTLLYPELTFCYKKDNLNEISNGSIDLLSIRDDKIIIYDYKSDVAEYIPDDLFEKTLDEKYKNQLDDYEGVVKGLYDLPIEKKIIYFRKYDKLNKEIEVKTYLIN